MKGEMDEHFERRMLMWKKRDEMLNALSEKELRAFIKGYMMGEHMVFRKLRKMNQCQCGSCGSCGCGDNSSCNCDKEQ